MFWPCLSTLRTLGFVRLSECLRETDRVSDPLEVRSPDLGQHSAAQQRPPHNTAPACPHRNVENSPCSRLLLELCHQMVDFNRHLSEVKAVALICGLPLCQIEARLQLWEITA